ncbi:wax ester synthase/diacylglycerol acyltransferase 4 [Spinacia oleracea]|uniref:Wax ester synthase/diacylglycerol acyltransferase 4 n=1 Tax=Spinacia oleracea TaxID=3562 RepID=A0ABM3RTZ3_SPIOL|nr:wax ester synthase/diacylglycerol acyltransferase 4-like [Spinacia oleracea]
MKLRVKTKVKSPKSSDEGCEPVSPTSECFLTMSVTSYILCFFELEFPPHFPSIYAFLNDVFLNVHPRFSSIVVKDAKGKKKWKKIEVNIKDHVKIPLLNKDNISTEEEYSTQYDDYISEIATSEIAVDKPLWELHIFNYPTKKSVSTLIFKFHHGIADGTSLMGVVLSCIQRSDDPSKPLTFPSRTTSIRPKENKNSHTQTIMKLFNIVPQFMASIFYSFYDLGQSLRLLHSEDDPTPIRSGYAKINQHYRICTVNLFLTDVKRIKTILGVTVNDVVIGIIFLGTRLYMQEMNNGRLKNTRSTVLITLNTRNDKGYARPEEMREKNTKVPWGNRFSLVELRITNLEEEDFKNPLKFILKAHKLIKRKKNTPFAQNLMTSFFGAVRTCRGLQAATRTFERRFNNSSFLVTNMIGPTEKMSLASHPIKGFYFMPTGLLSSLTVSVMSYMQTLTIGLAVEEGVIDHQRLITCVEKAFQLISQAATTTSN